MDRTRYGVLIFTLIQLVFPVSESSPTWLTVLIHVLEKVLVLMILFKSMILHKKPYNNCKMKIDSKTPRRIP